MTKIRKYNGVYKLPIKKHKVLIDIEDLDKMSKADYQYCNKLNKELR